MPFYKVEVEITSTRVYVLRAATPEHAAERFLAASPKERLTFFSHEESSTEQLSDDDEITVEPLSEDLHLDEILIWAEGLVQEGRLTMKKWKTLKSELPQQQGGLHHLVQTIEQSLI